MAMHPHNSSENTELNDFRKINCLRKSEESKIVSFVKIAEKNDHVSIKHNKNVELNDLRKCFI